MYKDFLTKDELEALLSPEEIDAFKTEQISRLDHELMLSPAHLLLAIRELEDTVMRLTIRIEHLEGRSVQHQVVAAPEPEIVQDEDPDPAIVHDFDFIDATEEEDLPDLSELIVQTMPDVLPEATHESILEPTPKVDIQQSATTPASSLISRSERHRERKPSLLSKLLK